MTFNGMSSRISLSSRTGYQMKPDLNDMRNECLCPDYAYKHSHIVPAKFPKADNQYEMRQNKQQLPYLFPVWKIFPHSRLFAPHFVSRKVSLDPLFVSCESYKTDYGSERLFP